MRKFLLACAATAGFAGYAHAGDLTAGSGSVYSSAKPGEVKVRLDAAVFTMIGFGSSTNDKVAVADADPVTAGAQPGTVKNDTFGIMNTFRFYPQLDGQTTGGLRYGASAEIRTNNPTSGSASRTTATHYLNRAFMYIGGDSWGMIRVGQGDGVFGLMHVGSFQNFAMGGLNGFAPGLIAAPDNYIWRFPFSQGGEYTPQKITYVSPSFAGFDIGLSFTPSTAVSVTSDITSVVAGGSARQATSAVAADAGRFRNMVQVMGRYRGTFGGVGVAANVGYMGSGAVKVAGVPNKGLSVIDAGATVSYMGFTVGGNVATGAFNGALTLSAPGEKNATVWLVGASYSSGPLTVGVHYLDSSRPGVFGNGAMQRESGIGAGASYVWAPGATAFVELAYHSRKENGVDFDIGTGVKNKSSGTALIVGQAFRW